MNTGAPIQPFVPILFDPAVQAVLKRRRFHHWLRVLGISLLVVLLLTGAGFGYLRHLAGNAPPPLSFADLPLATEAPADLGMAAPAPAAAPGDVPSAAAADPGSPDIAASAAAPATTPTRSDGTAATPTPQQSPPTSAVAAPAPNGAATGGTSSSLDGRWLVAPGSVAGYRWDYTAVGVSGTRVGRGTTMTGSFDLQGTTVTATEFSVDFREVKCDAGSQCDDHVQQMMAVDRFPYETFALTSPIELGRIPDDGEQISATGAAELTLRGATRPIEISVSARRNGDRIEVLGSIPVNREDYGIPDPDEPGFTIAKDGLIEFLLTFQHQA